MRATVRAFFAPVETLLTQRSALVAIISVVALGIVFVLTADNFLSNLALSNIITFSTLLGIIVLGVAVLMIAGEFDLSVGSAFATVGFTFAILLTGGMDPLLATAIAVLVGALLGAFNGTVVVGSGNPSFIITLGMLLGYRGIARAIGGGTVVSYQPEEVPLLLDIFNSGIGLVNELSMPAGNWRTSIIWFIVLAIIMIVVLHRTRFGNWVFATGGNQEAAKAQGVPIRRVKLAAFILVGIMVGISAVISFSERRSIDPLAASLWELFAVAGCVIGGLRLRGGFGTIAGAALGIVMISMLRQGLVLLEFSVEFFQAVFGVALISIAALNQYLSKSSD